jgi:all-trans-retinol dehydrogenase (NAD+)
MSWVLDVLVHVIKALWLTVWGTLRALLSIVPLRGQRKPELSSELCLVTGAGQGLGRQLALQMADCGASLVLWDIDEEKVKSVAEEVKSKCREAHVYVVDCSKREEVYEAAGKVADEVGVVSVLVNNAGIVTGRWLMEAKDESIENTFNVNTLAHYWTVKAFLPGMMKRNCGHIVSIASVMAFQGVPKLTDYSASKAAALSFAESLRYELRRQGKDGVHITAICPYHIRTELFKGVTTRFPMLMRSLSPDEVAARTLQAMAERQFIVVLPKTFFLAVFVKAVLPTEATDEVLDALGAGSGMDTFVGRNKSD